MQAIKNIAIIPARGGSKRIPNKNIKNFFGKPILAYVIETALESGLFDEVMVSTDSKEIADIASQYGAKVPFFRSEKASDDFATTSDVLKEVIGQYEDKGVKIESACCIYPSAVLINSQQLQKAHQDFKKWNYDSLISVLKFSFPIQRGFKEVAGKLKMIWPENKNKRSQDLETFYHDAGQFYFFNVDKFKQSNELYTESTGFLLLSEYEAQDIDNPEDWLMAELKYKFLKGKL